MPDFGAWTPADWAAAGTWCTALVAAAAGLVAAWQVREARRLRQEQAQPYVVAFMEPNPDSPAIIEFVVRNFGRTAATDVTLSCTPPLMRATSAQPEAVVLFDNLPVLVPGQEWRTFWDVGFQRHDSGLPSRHRVVVACRDSHQRPLPTMEFVLDWGAVFSREWIGRRSVDDLAKSLESIAKDVKTWGDNHRGLAVFVRDGHARDEQVREQRERMRRKLEDLERRSAAPDDAAAAPKKPARRRSSRS